MDFDIFFPIKGAALEIRSPPRPFVPVRPIPTEAVDEPQSWPKRWAPSTGGTVGNGAGKSRELCPPPCGERRGGCLSSVGIARGRPSASTFLRAEIQGSL